MSSRLRLFILAAACALTPGVVAGSTASAASLTITPEQDGSRIEVAFSGTADAPGYLNIEGVHGDSATCPDYGSFSDTTFGTADVRVPAAGPFSGSIGGDNHKYGRVLLCAYLTSDSSPGTVSATASAVVDREAPKEAIRANTNNRLDTAPVAHEGFSVWSMGCSGGLVNECDMQGTGTISVSDANRTKLRLPSTIIARGTIKKNGPQSWKLIFQASRSVIKRVRKASTLPVVFQLKLQEPFARTITFATKMLVRKGPEHYPSGLRPLYLDWDETGKRIYPRGNRGDDDGGGRGGRG
jgi:hypothetical protein